MLNKMVTCQNAHQFNLKGHSLGKVTGTKRNLRNVRGQHTSVALIITA